jgi:hypothetical protein
MRISASLTALGAAALLATQAHAQTADKPGTATVPKAQAQAGTKASATSNRGAAAPTQRLSGEAGKAKIEGVSTMRSMPAAGKKEGGCHSMDSDA